MTTIAWDGATLAADKRAVNNGLFRTTTKIFRVNDRLFGFCGDAAYGNQMLQWIRDGQKVEDFPKEQRDADTWTTTLCYLRINFSLVARGETSRWRGWRT